MKLAIGCHVMWYEIEMVGEYIDSLLQLIKQVPKEEHKNIYIDIALQKLLLIAALRLLQY